jgi:uncharacterized membrane protein
MRQVLRGVAGPCPECNQTAVHEPDCAFMAGKRRTFAVVLVIPLVILAVIAGLVDGGGDIIGGLVGALVGCALAGAWYRRRLARQRSR